MSAWSRRALERVLPGFAPPGDVPARRAMGAVLAEARGVTVELGGSVVLEEVDLTARAGEVVALVGPNGAGKSSLLAVLTGDLEPASGTVAVDDRELVAWSPTELARRRAVLRQQVALSFPFQVAEVVRMGRAPWAGTELEDDDEAVIAAALEETDVEHLAARRFTSLSGGEQARVALARVLAQATQLLLLDEPTAALDIHHQELVLAAARGRVRRGHGAVVVLHDLGLAAAYADRVVVLSEGRVAADGPPAEVLTADLLTAVYRHPVEVLPHPSGGPPLVVPVRTAPDLPAPDRPES